MEQVGYQKITGSIAVGSAGAPVEIWGAWVAAGQINFWSGIDANGTEVLSQGAGTQTFNSGIVFPSGCYIEDGSSGQATVFYRTIR